MAVAGVFRRPWTRQPQEPIAGLADEVKKTLPAVTSSALPLALVGVAGIGGTLVYPTLLEFSKHGLLVDGENGTKPVTSLTTTSELVTNASDGAVLLSANGYTGSCTICSLDMVRGVVINATAVSFTPGGGGALLGTAGQFVVTFNSTDNTTTLSLSSPLVAPGDFFSPTKITAPDIYDSTDVRYYGAKCDGSTDDTDADNVLVEGNVVNGGAVSVNVLSQSSYPSKIVMRGNVISNSSSYGFASSAGTSSDIVIDGNFCLHWLHCKFGRKHRQC